MSAPRLKIQILKPNQFPLLEVILQVGTCSLDHLYHPALSNSARDMIARRKDKLCAMVGATSVVVLIGLVACKPSSTITLGSDQAKLVYDCSAFQPQAETAGAIVILRAAYIETLQHAIKHQSLVTYRSLLDAHKQRDWRQLERLIVEYRCAHRSDFLNK